MYPTYDRQEIYAVSPDDTCKKIAKKHNIRVDDLLKYNFLGKRYQPIVGQHLLIPGGSYQEKIHILAIIRKHLEKMGCKKFFAIIVEVVQKGCLHFKVPVILVVSNEESSRYCEKFSLNKDLYIVDGPFANYELYDLKLSEEVFAKDINISCFHEKEYPHESFDFFESLCKCDKKGKLYASKEGIIYERLIIGEIHPNIEKICKRKKKHHEGWIVYILVIELIDYHSEWSESSIATESCISVKSSESIYDKRTPNVCCPFTIFQLQSGKFKDDCEESLSFSEESGYTSESFEYFEVIPDESSESSECSSSTESSESCKSSSDSSNTGRYYNHRRYPQKKVPLKRDCFDKKHKYLSTISSY